MAGQPKSWRDYGRTFSQICEYYCSAEFPTAQSTNQSSYSYGISDIGSKGLLRLFQHSIPSPRNFSTPITHTSVLSVFHFYISFALIISQEQKTNFLIILFST